MKKVTVPEGAIGDWRVERFEVDRVDIHSLLRGRGIPLGTYTRLMRRGTIVMSDTPAEMNDHRLPVYHASGSCLINGLGLGMVLQAVLDKPKVTDVTVIEKSRDVFDLVAPHYRDKRVTIILADAFDFKPPRGKRYQMVWHDIWDEICADNLSAMDELREKYKRRAKWQGSWGEHHLRRER